MVLAAGVRAGDGKLFVGHYFHVERVVKTCLSRFSPKRDLEFKLGVLWFGAGGGGARKEDAQ
jgi:hypothetical protein